jgi:ABC-type branched-subunit amino acid transport system ATPase component
MKLICLDDYISIKKFEPVELPEFSIITGLNGVGKSQLLRAIKSGSISIEGIPTDQIIFYDNKNFSLDNENEILPTTIKGEKENILTVIQNEFTRMPGYHGFLEDPSLIKMAEFSAGNRIPFYHLSQEHFEKNGFIDKFHSYDQFRTFTYNQAINLRSGTAAKIMRSAILRLMQTILKPLPQLIMEDLDNTYVPIGYNEDFLVNQIGKLFFDYNQKWDENQYSAYRVNESGETFEVLSLQEFENKHGEKPWNIFNRILKRFGSLEYMVNSPEGLHRDKKFILKLVNSKDQEIQINFENLSSGERIMLALASSLLKVRVDNLFPKLLLLDEIDSGLHPSMVQNMLDILEKELLGVKHINIILVTHSPSTIAFAPEESIYVMNKSGEPRILKTSKKDALKILTEGFASLTHTESNLQVSYNISKASDYVLLTEGITDRMNLESAWQALEEGLPNFDLQDCFDAGFLRNLIVRGEIFTNYPAKIFIALFDFDKEGYDSWNFLKDFDLLEPDPRKGLLKKHRIKNAYAILLPAPDPGMGKQVIKDGNITFENQSHLTIELLFSEIPIAKKYFFDEQQVGGGLIKKFRGDKVGFAEMVKAKFVEADFVNFIQLFTAIKKIFIPK